MPVLALITLIALIMLNSGQTVRPVVTCSPNWNHIYTGDSVTLKCDIGSKENIDKFDFYWYKDNKRMQQEDHEFTINKATYSNAGEYECWTGSGDRSHPLRLYVMDKDFQNRRPTVIFRPNFRNIFVGEEMEISCKDGSGGRQSQKYEWYKNNAKLEDCGKTITIKWPNSKNSGDYRCKKGSADSYPVRLSVYTKNSYKLILQTPPNIVEGDRLYLRCHSPTYYNDEDNTTFYKEGAVIQMTGRSLQLSNVNKSLTGTYRCVKALKDGKLLEVEKTFLFVQDLFTSPNIKVSPSIEEGDVITMMCDTRRNPLQEDTELHFTFYRNGQKVEEAELSDTYTVRSAQLEDSGNYTCLVWTPSYTVMKMSDVSYLNITELFKKPTLQIRPEQVQEGDIVTIKCLSSKWLPTASYTFYRNSQMVQHETFSNYTINHATEEDTASYQCSLTYRNILKNSSEQMMVVQIAVKKPNLMVSPNKVVVGDKAVLQCESSKGSLPIQYLFYHDETLLGNITIHQKEAAELQLTIKSLTMGGLYYCASYNDVHSEHLHSEEVNLLVMESVSGINISTDKEGEAFVLGESLTFTCSIQRGTPISIFWLHNHSVVKQSSELYQLQDNGKVLYIHSLQHYHKGTYQCNAKNELSDNNTFSVLREIRNINVSELSADDRVIQWSMLGILLLVIIIASGLTITCCKKRFAARSCCKTPSTVMRREQNNEEVNKQNTVTGQEVVYANIPSKKNLDNEDDGCTYITVKAVQAASSYSDDVPKNNITVLYSKVKCAKVTSGTRADNKTPETSDSTDIYHNITAHNINAD
ncbi:Fc receptor-like protein 5 [Dendrobates tinctorius]|uniref:Fc receptor-like protein 5 n=1 Tax=Dendrobates tinctorius TaxID=92724 RepID=UPI003CCA122B